MPGLQTVELLTHFEGVSDPRRGNARRHLLMDMIVIALCAAICGAESWVDVARFGREKREWFRRFLRVGAGPPRDGPFGRGVGPAGPGGVPGLLADLGASLKRSLAG